ncbi:MAG: hypothetical protein II748_03175 [Clostridia bacterium]|nr:hypothetical protein [Clostridia bacterium]
MKKNLLLKIAVVLLAMALVAGIYTLFVIPSVRKEEQEKSKKEIARITEMYVSVPIYNGETPLVKGTLMTEALAGLFTAMKVPAASLNAEMLTDIGTSYGFQLAGTLSKGEPLTIANLERADLEENEEERLKEFAVSSLVCEKVVPGTYIDVVVRYEDGTYDVVLVKKRVHDVRQTADAEGKYTVVIPVTEGEYADMLAARKLGELDTRLYLDEKHPASTATFGEKRS